MKKLVLVIVESTVKPGLLSLRTYDSFRDDIPPTADDLRLALKNAGFVPGQIVKLTDV